MKKRRLFLAFLLVFMTILTSIFGTVASAANYDVEYDENNNKYEYDKGYNSSDVSKKLSDIETSDGAFYFERGAAIYLREANVLAFNLNTKDSDAINFEKGIANTTSDTWYEYEYVVSLIRKNKNNAYGSEATAYLVNFSTRTKKYTVSNLLKAKSPYTSDLSINNIFTQDGQFEPLSFGEVYDSTGNFDRYRTRIYAKVGSVYDEYTAVFSYKKIKYKAEAKFKLKWPWQAGISNFWTVTTEITSTVEDKSLIKSDERSYDYVLQKTIEAGEIKLEAESGDTQKETEIKETLSNIINGEEKTVTVEYLKNISDTPFAERVKAQITLKIPANTTTLSPDAVASALNVANVNCLLSQCKEFALSGSSYVATYSKSVWLSAKTVDGNSLNYFLDPNLSYEDYFGALARDGIISEDLYEYIFFTKIVNEYKELSGLSPSDVYGYFGYIVIPETFTYNQAFAEMFGKQTKFDGVVKEFEYSQSLSLSSYNKLLKDYDYSWLERVWNGVWGALTQCNANHYIIYADATTSESFINENNADTITDTDGLIANKVEKVVETIKNYEFKLNAKTGSMLAIIVIAGIVIVVYRTQGLYKTQKRYKKASKSKPKTRRKKK